MTEQYQYFDSLRSDYSLTQVFLPGIPAEQQKSRRNFDLPWTM